MFSKTALTLLALGALYVNALTVPIARSPVPEPEFQDLLARVNFDWVKREIIGDLLSREPEGWVQVSKRAPTGRTTYPKCSDVPKGYLHFCLK